MGFKFYPIFMLMLCLLASCSDINKEFEESQSTSIHFYGEAVRPTLQSTKVSNSLFLEDDSIGLFMKQSGSVLSKQTIVDDVDNQLYVVEKTAPTAIFIPLGDSIIFPTPGPVDFIAYSPARLTIPDNYLYSIDLSGLKQPAQIQDYDLVYSDNATNQLSANVALNFRHVMSYMLLYVFAEGTLLPTDLQDMTLSMSNIPITGEFNLATGTFSSVSEATAELTFPGSYAPAGEFFAAEGLVIPQGGQEGRSFIFRLADGSVLTYTIPSDQEYTPGYFYIYTFTLSPATQSSVKPKALPAACFPLSE